MLPTRTLVLLGFLGVQLWWLLFFTIAWVLFAGTLAGLSLFTGHAPVGALLGAAFGAAWQRRSGFARGLRSFVNGESAEMRWWISAALVVGVAGVEFGFGDARGANTGFLFPLGEQPARVLHCPPLRGVFSSWSYRPCALVSFFLLPD
jgi:hypothetical protein